MVVEQRVSLLRSVGIVSIVWAEFIILMPSVCSAQAVVPANYSAWSNGPNPGNDPNYFPIGVWYQQPFNAWDYKAMGVNFYAGLYNGPTESDLATLKSAGMKAIVQQNAVGLAHVNDPNVIGWFEFDEPDDAQPNSAGGYDPPVTPAALLNTYTTMKANDPTRPVWVNFSPGVADDSWIGRGTRTGHPEDYPLYTKAGDITSFDYYPIAEAQAPISQLVNGVDRLRQWSAPTQPTWTFIETTNIFGVGGPTAAQVKSEIWASLIHGSRGIIYFAHQMSPTFDDAALLHNSAMNAAVTGIDQQILSLAPALNSPTITGQSSIASSDSSIPLDLMEKSGSTGRYLFASSYSDGTATGTFTIQGAGAGSFVDVLGESRTIPIVNGTFADSFGPYAVHLYQVVPEPTAAGLLSFAIPALMLRKRSKSPLRT